MVRPPSPGITTGSPFERVLNEALRGTLTGQEMAAWVLENGPSATEVQTVLDAGRANEPHINLGFQVVNGQIVENVNNPATAPLAPGILGPPGSATNPGQVGGGSGSSGGQSDWTHLFIRLAEFAVGAILVIIGFNAIVAKTKTGQKIEVLATGVAGRIPK